MHVRHAIVADAAVLQAIYNYEVENTAATFDMVPRSLAEQRAWIRERDGALGVIVAVLNDKVVGFASLSSYRDRPAYNTTVEDSIYIDQAARGLGVGKALLMELIDMGKSSGFHSVIAHIGGSQEASIALHTACGFEPIGVQREVGRKFGKWLDVTVMQLMLG